MPDIPIGPGLVPEDNRVVPGYFGTIPEMLAHYAHVTPDRPALFAPDHAPLTYGTLLSQVEAAVHDLRAFDIGRDDRIAAVAPNGIVSALATLTTASAAICTPLNPLLTSDEFRRYYTETAVVAVLAGVGEEHPGQTVARELGLAVVEGAITADGTWTVRLKAAARRVVPDRSAPWRPAAATDDAFILLTSGTTSRPKLVPITHAAACRSASNAGASLSLRPSDRLLNMMPLFHAHGLFSGLLAALAAGSSVVCTGGFVADRFFDWLRDFEPSWYTAVPTIHGALLAAASGRGLSMLDGSLRLIRSASSSLPPEMLAALETLFGVPVIETYGMTEGASQIAANPLLARKPRSVGVSAGAEIAIIDNEGRALPPGQPGEIALRSPTITRGYPNDPAATASAFRDGWFRTGDLGTLDGEGYLFILGRLKDLINRGGQNIAPVEIEQVLLSHPAVAEAAVFPAPHPKLGEEVAAAIVLRPGARTGTRALQAFARKQLATFKVPRRIQIVSEIPKTAIGKINRSALAGALGMTNEAPRPLIAPRLALEAELVALWSQVLACEPFGTDQDVFALGAESLAAVQMLSRIRTQFGVKLSFENLLDAPTVALLAAHIRRRKRRGVPAPSAPMHGEPDSSADVPLSFQQHRTLMLGRLDPSGSAYHVLDVARLTGPLDADKLAASLGELCTRHDILRTTIREHPDGPVQIVGIAGPGLARADFGELPARARASTIRREALVLVGREFDFAHEQPLRLRLLRLGDDDHALLVVFHHIATDGWSNQIFWAELQALYRAALEQDPSGLTPVRLQYRDYVTWQQRWMRLAAAEAQRRYWRQQLSGLTALPLRSQRTALPERSGRGARSPLLLSRTLTRRLKSFSRQQHVTPFMTLLAAFQTVLHRHTLHHDIAVSSVLANRTRVDFEPLFGMLANTVILRVDFSDDPSVETLLQRIRKVTIGAFRHGELPIEEVLRGVRFPDGADRRAPFSAMFILQQRGDGARTAPGIAWPGARPGAGDLTLRLVDIDPGTAHEDLLLELREDDERFGGWLEYNADLFDAATAARMVAHLQMALESMLSNPQLAVSQLPLVPESERQLVLGWGRGELRTRPGGSFAGGFFAQAAASPEAVAVSFGSTRWSYGQLAQRSAEIGAALREHGVGHDSIVALVAGRGPGFLAAMVGVQWAGAAFLPLDPAHPPSRLVQLIAQSAAPVVLTDVALAATLAAAWVNPSVPRPHFLNMRTIKPTARPPHAQPADPDPASLAYVIFTSGSTGTPKGAMIEQRGLLNHLQSKVEDLPLSAADVVAQTAPQSFDISVWQFLAPLLAGARVHICPDAETRDPATLIETIAREGVTILQVVPALLRALLEQVEDDGRRRALRGLRTLLVTGEAVAPDLVQDWLARLPDIPVINAYGPAECADDVAIHTMTALPDPFDPVPIGRPIANTRLYVLDAHGALAPANVAGELHVAGAGVGRGYLNEVDLTRQCFLQDGFARHPGQRLYRTGDRARWRGDGVLEFLGRVDDQLKLRGYRIEPGEIERRLLDNAEVAACAVLLQLDTDGREPRLVAHVVPAAGTPPTAERLRAFLIERLPFYMIPSAFVQQERLPLTRHGKLDRMALAASAAPLPADRDNRRRPNTPDEQRVASIWAELIGAAPVAASANFFDLGGHSLLAGKVLARIAQACGVTLSLRAFFAAPTVEGLARAVDAARSAAAPSAQVAPATSMERERARPTILQFNMLRREWALPGLPQFNLPFAFRLRGRLDVAALERSVSALIDRHESLRTSFTERDEGVSVAPPGKLPAPLVIEDLTAGISVTRLPASGLLLQKAAIRVEQVAWTAFALEQPPLFRVRLLRLGADDHVLVLVVHHVIVDGWSIELLMGELSAAYASLTMGRALPWTAPAPAFSAFARWQRDWLATPPASRQREDWQQAMQGAGESSRSFGLAAARVTGAVEHAPIDLPAALVAKLAAFSRAESTTLFATLLAGFKALLLARLGGTDICVATVMANRPELWMEPIVGLLANTVVVRSQLADGLPFHGALGRVSGAVVAAFNRQQQPFELLLPLLHEEAGLNRGALTQAAFVLRSTAEPLELAGLAVEPFGAAYLQGQPVLPLGRTWITVSLKAVGSGFTGACSCKVGPLPRGAARYWASEYRTVLERAAANPGSMLRDLAPLSRSAPALKRS